VAPGTAAARPTTVPEKGAEEEGGMIELWVLFWVRFVAGIAGNPHKDWWT